jgi:hypothetical protein
MTVSHLHYDDRLANHEAAHGLVIVLEGGRLIWVNANRHSLQDNHGEATWLHDPTMTYEQRARMTVAGNVEGSLFSKSDDEYARLLWAAAGSPPGWLEEREAEVREVLRANLRAYNALVSALSERNGILLGPTAESIIRYAS